MEREANTCKEKNIYIYNAYPGSVIEPSIIVVPLLDASRL